MSQHKKRLTVLDWHKTLTSIRNPRVLFSGVLATFLAVGITQNTSAEMLTFSIIHEKYRLDSANSENRVSRVEQPRRLFLAAPLDGDALKISSKFGLRHHPIVHKQKAHNGIDYAAPSGTPIRTTADGTIEFVGRQKGYGKVIVVRHLDNLSTIYAHQSRFAHGLSRGDLVSQGDTIGYVGSTGTATGNNLHYEVRIDDKPVDPLKLDRLYVENEYAFLELEGG